jgi:hypothetical protein
MKRRNRLIASICIAVLGIGFSTAVAGEKRDAGNEAQGAVTRALTFLKDGAVRWRAERQCASCHEGAMTVWAMNEAKTFGYAVDAAYLAEATAWGKLPLTGLSKPRDPRPGRSMVSTFALYMSVGAQNQPGQTLLSEAELKTIADHAGRHLEDDGSALTPATMDPPLPLNGPPPTWESREVLTLFAVLGMYPGANADVKEPNAAQEGRARALRYLAGISPGKDNQTQALRLLLAVQKKKPKKTLREAADAILKRQNSDAGWSQIAGLPSDAYATGQNLYALSIAGVDRKKSGIKRAVRFLTETQREDGSWAMTRRGHPGITPGPFTQPIVYIGSAWATIGLVRNVPAKD